MKTIMICILVLVAMGLIIVLVSSPVDAQAPGNEVFLPFICKNGLCGGEAIPAPTPSPTMPLGCVDPSRGELYRALVTNTQTIFDSIASWSIGGECCSIEDAQAAGHTVGDVLQLIPTALFKMLGAAWQLIASSATFIGSILQLTGGTPIGYDVQCTNDAEFFCLGLAAIVALDDMAGGWVTVLTILVVAIMGFYLAIYVIQEVRNMMQPGSGDS